MSRLVLAVLALSVGLWSGAAAAQVTYEYTGNDFSNVGGNPAISPSFSTSDSISGSFSLAAPLAPNLALTSISPMVESFSFSAGPITIDDTSAVSALMFVSTDATGAISDWRMQFATGSLFGLAIGGSAGDQFNEIFTRTVLPSGVNLRDSARVTECLSGTMGCTATGTQNAFLLDSPGTWTFIPEPSTALLMGLGLAGLARVRKQ